MEKKRFILFISVFVLIFIILNYLFINNIFVLLNIPKGFVFYFLLLILSFSYPLAVFLERYKPTVFTRAFYRLNSIWLGITFFSLFIFLIYKFIKLIFPINEQVGSTLVLFFILIMSLVALINGGKLKINPVDLHIKGLKKDLKIVHLSDLHIGAVYHKEYLKEIVNNVNSLNPDVVVVTGDLIDGGTVVNEEILSPINKIKAPVYFVVGNHEIYDGLDKVIPLLNKTKMNILRGQSAELKGINFIGLDYSDSKKEVLDKLTKMDLKKDKANILLYHAPIFKTSELEKMNIKLHLAGHTHRGQIFPFNLFVKLIYPYNHGLHKSNKSAVFVSSGTGTWGPPMRLGSFNEINLINLKKEKN